MRNTRIDLLIDLLRTLAIVEVVLYHMPAASADCVRISIVSNRSACIRMQMS